MQRASQHSQLISPSGIVCYELSEGESEKEGIYFERNAFGAGDRYYKNTKALSLRSSEDMWPNPFLASFLFRGLESVLSSSPPSLPPFANMTQLTDKDEYFTCKRTVTKQRTALAAEAMHSTPRRNTPTTKHVLGVASQFCPDVHAAHCNMVLYTAQNILHESPGPLLFRKRRMWKQLVCAVLTRLTYMPAPHCFIWSMFRVFSYRQCWILKGHCASDKVTYKASDY